MTRSPPEQEAWRGSGGAAHRTINSIDGHFLFNLVRGCTEAKRRCSAAKHLLTALWSGVGRTSCHRHIRSRQGKRARRKKVFWWFNWGFALAVRP